MVKDEKLTYKREEYPVYFVREGGMHNVDRVRNWLERTPRIVLRGRGYTLQEVIRLSAIMIEKDEELEKVYVDAYSEKFEVPMDNQFKTLKYKQVIDIYMRKKKKPQSKKISK